MGVFDSRAKDLCASNAFAAPRKLVLRSLCVERRHYLGGSSFRHPAHLEIPKTSSRGCRDWRPRRIQFSSETASTPILFARPRDRILCSGWKERVDLDFHGSHSLFRLGVSARGTGARTRVSRKQVRTSTGPRPNRPFVRASRRGRRGGDNPRPQLVRLVGTRCLLAQRRVHSRFGAVSYSKRNGGLFSQFRNSISDARLGEPSFRTRPIA